LFCLNRHCRRLIQTLDIFFGRRDGKYEFGVLLLLIVRQFLFGISWLVSIRINAVGLGNLRLRVQLAKRGILKALKLSFKMSYFIAQLGLQNLLFFEKFLHFGLLFLRAIVVIIVPHKLFFQVPVLSFPVIKFLL
jgi:hypothetical protein